MKTGHGGVTGILRSGSRQRTSTDLLLALLAASVAPDILDLLFFTVGFCNPYGLYSHTVYIVALQAAVISGLAYLATESRATALTFATVVMLHVVADLITGHKLLLPGGDLIGLHLYTRAVLDWAIETPLALLGWWLLRRTGNAPRWATSIMAAVALVVVQTAFGVYALTHQTGVKPNACVSSSIALAPTDDGALVASR